MTDDIEQLAWWATSAMPTLTVPDLEEAIRFYESIAFEEQWRFPDPSPHDYPDGMPEEAGRNWTHACVSIGDVALMLMVGDPPDAAISPQNVYVFLQGIEAYHAHVTETLGSKVPELEDQHYGMCDFTIRDPWGHQLTFGQSLHDDEDE